MSSKTDKLRELLDERWVEYEAPNSIITMWTGGVCSWIAIEDKDGLAVAVNRDYLTPEQTIEATLGSCNCSDSERTYGTWVSSTWERWYKSLRHDEIKSIGDAVEQLMYEVIEFGGDMGPNGNTYNGIDEGDVLTSGFINEWIKRFESTLGRDKYSYKQWREISNAVGDAMEYAHNKAIECPDNADPLWNLDEYVNRILKAAFEGEATLGSSNCTNDCTNSERTDVPCLPHFWTHDGALHVELPKLPESISVRLPAQRDREVGSARVWQYTLGDADATPTRQGDGTCHADETDTLECVCDQVGRYGKRVTIHVMECSECGRTYEHVNGDYEFCPRCGRRVVEVDG